jgi:hypothetical protein
MEAALNSETTVNFCKTMQHWNYTPRRLSSSFSPSQDPKISKLSYNKNKIKFPKTDFLICHAIFVQSENNPTVYPTTSQETVLCRYVINKAMTVSSMHKILLSSVDDK